MLTNQADHNSFAASKSYAFRFVAVECSLSARLLSLIFLSIKNRGIPKNSVSDCDVLKIELMESMTYTVHPVPQKVMRSVLSPSNVPFPHVCFPSFFYP